MFKNIFKKVYNIHFIPPFLPQVTRSFHFDVQKSFGTFNKTSSWKKQVEECFSSKCRKKIEDTSDSVYASKAINDTI